MCQAKLSMYIQRTFMQNAKENGEAVFKNKQTTNKKPRLSFQEQNMNQQIKIIRSSKQDQNYYHLDVLW